MVRELDKCEAIVKGQIISVISDARAKVAEGRCFESAAHQRFLFEQALDNLEELSQCQLAWIAEAILIVLTY